MIFIARAIWAVSFFAAVPVIVGGIGTEAFGLWESLLAIGASAAILQTIAGQTLLWRISHLVEMNQPTEAERLIRVGFSFTLLMFLVFVPVAYFCHDAIVQLMRIPADYQATVAWLFPATVGLLALGGLNHTLMSALAGRQHAGTAAGIQVAGLLAATLVNIVAIWFQAGIAAMWYGAAAGFLLTFTALLIATWRAYGGISLGPVLPTRHELAVLIPFASLLLLSNVTLLCRDHLDKILLTVMDTANSTGYYAIAQRLTSIIINIIVVMQLPLMAAIGASHARGDWKNIERIYGQSSQWLAFLSCQSAIAICTFRTPLLIVWFGHDIGELHAYLATTIWGTTAAAALSAAAVILAKGIGRPGLETSSMMITLALTLLSKPIAVAWYGPLGAIVSSAASWGLGSTLLLWIVHRETGLSNHILRRSLASVVVAGVMSIGLWNVTSILPAVQQRATAALMLGAGTLVLGVVYWFMLFGCGVAPRLSDSFRRILPARTLDPTLEQRRAA